MERPFKVITGHEASGQATRLRDVTGRAAFRNEWERFQEFWRQLALEHEREAAPPCDHRWVTAVVRKGVTPAYGFAFFPRRAAPFTTEVRPNDVFCAHCNQDAVEWAKQQQDEAREQE